MKYWEIVAVCDGRVLDRVTMKESECECHRRAVVGDERVRMVEW